MSDPQSASSTPLPTLPLTSVLSAISNPVRWHLLRHLAAGEQLMVSELAEAVGQSADATSKNMALLRSLGIVTQGRNRLYQIPPQFLADKTDRFLDFGYCLLRMECGQIGVVIRRDSQTDPFDLRFPFLKFAYFELRTAISVLLTRGIILYGIRQDHRRLCGKQSDRPPNRLGQRR